MKLLNSKRNAKQLQRKVKGRWILWIKILISISSKFKAFGKTI